MSFVIKNVLTPDLSLGSVLEIVAVDGRVLRIELEGVCCSQSFFDKDSVLDVKALLGQTLLKLSDVYCEGREAYEGSDVTKCHALVLRTNAESISLMWRNESNGYYDGFVHVTLDGNRLNTIYGCSEVEVP